jgi:hypothetical protein
MELPAQRPPAKQTWKALKRRQATQSPSKSQGLFGQGNRVKKFVTKH